MKKKYVISYYSASPHVELFLLKGPNLYGRWYAYPTQVRGKQAERLCVFSSIEEIKNFLEGSPSVRPIYDVPELFRLNPEFESAIGNLQS